jgi:hypothetical protein
MSIAEILYQTLKYNEFDLQGRCKCCVGDRWVGHAGWCKVGMAIAEYEKRNKKKEEE